MNHGVVIAMVLIALWPAGQAGDADQRARTVTAADVARAYQAGVRAGRHAALREAGWP
jgi:hypothetical protein